VDESGAVRDVKSRDLNSYIKQVIDHYLEGSVVAYHAEHLEEVMVAEQGSVTEGEKSLLNLLKKRLRSDLRKAA
jgi:hypothetical protein